MKLLKTLIMLTAATGSLAFAEEKRIWECRTSHEGASPILHLVDWGSRSYVKFAHLRFSAERQQDDDSQGWYFNNDGSGYYRYALVLSSSGRAWFHDFRNIDEDGLSAPLDYFLCTRTS